MSSGKVNKKMLTAGWVMLALAVFLLTFMFQALAPRYYRYRKNQILMNAYRDVKNLDLSELDEEACDVIKTHESENLCLIISDDQRNRLYVTQTMEYRNSPKDLERWREEYSTEPVIFYQQDNGLRLAKLRAIVVQGMSEYYVYIKERNSNVNDYNKIIMPFMSVLGLASVLVFGGGLWLCWRRFGVQFKREENISKDRQVQQKLRSERMERLQKDFVARMTHELKTPLAVISSQVEMLEYVSEPGAQKQYIDSVKEEVERISGMVGNMLDISVVEHQMEHLLQNRLDMREIMEYVAMKYEGIISKKQVRLETFFDDGCIVRGDREYIEQALNNFMMNALEHTPMRGNVRMTLKKRKEFVRAAVYNEGAQIPKKDQEQLWDGYYRNEQDQDTDSSMPHAGLGLSIARNAVWMHGGICGVKNMDQGVEFWFEIPAEKSR